MRKNFSMNNFSKREHYVHKLIGQCWFSQITTHAHCSCTIQDPYQHGPHFKNYVGFLHWNMQRWNMYWVYIQMVPKLVSTHWLKWTKWKYVAFKDNATRMNDLPPVLLNVAWARCCTAQSLGSRCLEFSIICPLCRSFDLAAAIIQKFPYLWDLQVYTSHRTQQN